MTPDDGRGRPPIHERAMTPTERQRRWRAKAREAEIRAESSVRPDRAGIVVMIQ